MKETKKAFVVYPTGCARQLEAHEALRNPVDAKLAAEPEISEESLAEYANEILSKKGIPIAVSVSIFKGSSPS